LANRTDVELHPFAIGRGRSTTDLRRIRIPLRVMHGAWKWTGAPRIEWLVGGADVLHSLDIVPPPSRLPLVVTVHDVLAATQPSLYSSRHAKIGRAQLASLARARVVTATCEATADQIAAAAGVDRSRIVVAPPGASCTDRWPDAPPPIPPPYVLAVGSLTPRKGFGVLARALATLGIDRPPLVIAGPDGWEADKVRRDIAASGVTAHVLGRVDETTLHALYRHATLLCHPSIAEGFGMPCLEAMAHGVPVVAADIPSVREVGNGAIRLAPAGDPAALAEALAVVLGDRNIRSQMSNAGRERAALYTWERTVERTVEAYRRALA
jgi:glycosyltransferase involved in cell wall biosynthesis